MNTLLLDTKVCMKQLLLSPTFDAFYFKEGEIATAATYTLDGTLNAAYFDTPPAAKYSVWRDIRPFCFSIIKGRKTPLHFNFLLSAGPDLQDRFLQAEGLMALAESLDALYLNFRFSSNTLHLITGVALAGFTLDKTLEKSWDTYAQGLLNRLEIPFELL